METALEGVQVIELMMKECNLPLRLSDINIHEKDLEGMTESAMKITRLLKNNPRDLTSADARGIYMEAL
jgi:alcohol dehydrogenase class IV